MTTSASTWKKIIRRHPNMLAVVMLALWLIQLAHWAVWELRREPIIKDLRPPQTIAQQTDIHIEAPFPIDDPDRVHICPFTMQLPITDTPEFQDEHYLLNEPQFKTPAPVVSSPKTSEDATPVTPPKDPTKALGTLRYRGFMQTSRGKRIAFIEDKKAHNILRIEVGKSIEEWELTAIARDRIIFATKDEPPFEILRQLDEPEPAPPEAPAPKPKTKKQDAESEATANTPEKEKSDS